jgi:RNA polymerase sigma factor (sigma-70 family)
MPRSDSDLLASTERELERLTNEELLRLTVICRDGDRTSARKAKSAWKMLVARDIDRIRGIVASFRHPDNASVRVARDDVDAVTQDAYIRLARIAFKGESVPEYRGLMRKCVSYQCKDHCRADMAADMHRAGSLDEKLETENGDSRPRYEREVAELEEERLAEEAALEEEVERLGEQRKRLTDSIAKIPDEPKRRVLEMTMEGRSTKDMAAALGTSEANVYQLRTRALKLIKKMLDGEEDS